VGNNTATVTAYHNGSEYIGSWKLSNEKYATITNGVITLNKAPDSLTPITIIESKHDATTTITLLPDSSTPVENY
jgi:hypothetical protein